MPRSYSQSSSQKHAPKSSAVVPSYHPPSVTTNRIEIEKPTLGQSLKQGFGFGAGSAIAHRIFGMAPTIIAPAPSQSEVKLPCDKERTAFENCMKTKSSDDFCGEQQIAYTHCLHLGKKD